MSSYFIAVNLDRREFLHAHPFGDGLDFREFCGSSNGFLAGLAYLLRSAGACEHPDTVVGSWFGNRVALVADNDSSGLYDHAYEADFKDVSLAVIRAMVRCPTVKAALEAKTRWRRLEGCGNLLADAAERRFYREVFGGADHPA